MDRFLHGHQLETKGIVVAVSGGPDSVALLRALLALRPGMPIAMAHLNHRLRGEESDRDEAFARALQAQRIACGAAALELRCHTVDVAKISEDRGDNLESAARRLRYDWLGQVAEDLGYRCVATGHTADDQAETVLHRLLRGTGIQGLRGIAARRPLAAGIELIRPMLECSRAEVLEYLRTIHQDFCSDSSNLDLRLTRNRIRHQLLPLLVEQFNPAVVSVLCRLASQAGEAFREEEMQACELLKRAELPRAGPLLVFDQSQLASAPPHVVRALFRFVWEREGWPTGQMNWQAWNWLLALVGGKEFARDLPGTLRAQRKGKIISIGPVS